VSPEKIIELVKNGEAEDISTRKANIITGLMDSWDIETKDLGRNGFGMYNAVTHYFSNTRGKDETDLLFGDFGRKETKTINFVEALAS
jgi:hypothetical protein